MEKKVFETTGTCSKMIEFELDGNIVKSVKFIGGCAGNTAGVAKLVEGMNAQEVIKRLKGIDCHGKGTSCPDQLARALEEAISRLALLKQHVILTGESPGIVPGDFLLQKDSLYKNFNSNSNENYSTKYRGFSLEFCSDYFSSKKSNHANGKSNQGNYSGTQ